MTTVPVYTIYCGHAIAHARLALSVQHNYMTFSPGILRLFLCQKTCVT